MTVFESQKLKGLEPYLEKVARAKYRGNKETAFRIPKVDFDTVVKGLKELGLVISNLEPVFSHTWGKQKIDYQRVLVQWEAN